MFVTNKRFACRAILPLGRSSIIDGDHEADLRRKRINLPFALFLSLATAAQCQSASTNKCVADLQWFSGHWSCDGKFTRSGQSISADFSFEPILQSKWMLFRHDDLPPFSYHALSEWGWDEKGQQYISTMQDSAGGSHSELFVPAGWKVAICR